MMTELEGNNYLYQLLNLAKSYVDSEVTWAEVTTKGLLPQLLKGESFPNPTSQS